jgi:hypothetical protein
MQLDFYRWQEIEISGSGQVWYSEETAIPFHVFNCNVLCVIYGRAMVCEDLEGKEKQCKILAVKVGNS